MKRREAKALGLLYYNTGKSCRNGHLADRIVSKGICRQCALEHSRTAREKARRRSYAAQPALKAARADYAKTAISAARAVEYTRQWQRKQRGVDQPGRPRNRHALPEHWPWIADLYAMARKHKLTVDHVLPLNGETVSGLHVLWNLQLLTRSENATKWNKV